MKINQTYQQQDSILQQNNVDTILKSNTLKLLQIEDESALIIPSKISNNKVLTKKSIVLVSDSNYSEIDTNFYNQGFDNIPTRKISPIATQKQDKSDEELLYSPAINNSINTSWQTILLLIAFGLLGFVKAFSSTRFNQIFKSIFSFQAAEEVVREEKVFFHRVNLSLFVLYLIGLLLLIVSFLIFKTGNTITDGFYVKVAIFILATYGVKFISVVVISAIFSRVDLSATYTYNTLIYNYLFGVILLPCLAFIFFSTISFDVVFNYVILPSFTLIFLARIFRLFIIGKQNNFFVLYIILYICTLEILPLVVLSKFFIFN
ncbi:DUF4271 domain-containing protein [Vicingus serpentipes]|uniref:DUF4271 domain-containing protein n=1 Tax=Vicingus serpentipes TaxID=1926625 RepID=UPI0014768EAF|nr:DUF4271 domain-containing protein [Vicingus serpentipes]